MLAFLLTWPLEQRRQSVVSRDQYQEQARQLTRLLLHAASGLGQSERILLQNDLAQETYPTEPALALFQRVNAQELSLSAETRYRWKLDYPIFQTLQRSVVEKPGATTPFQLFGLKSRSSGFTAWITHPFLHAGWLHLLFNMLFLWTAGLVLEPLLGGKWLGLYLSSGVAAAWAQTVWGIPPAQIMVGASGAIAGLMGFALAAVPCARVTLFYIHMFMLLPRGGQFDSPLWFCVPLWALQQVFMMFMPFRGELAQVGYAAHVGGFTFGFLIGLVYRAARRSAAQ